MIALREHPEGVVLPIKAQPGARRNALRGVHDSALRVAVTQIAEKGKANDAICKLVAKELGLKNSQVELLSGTTSSHKELLIRGIAAEQLAKRIQEKLSDLTP